MDIGTGITVKIGIEAFGEVVDIGLPEAETSIIDTSHYLTVGGRTFMAGDLIDNGELKIDLALDPAAPANPPGTTGVVVVTFPDASTWTFSGIVSKNGNAAPMEDKMISSVVIKISGDIAYA